VNEQELVRLETDAAEVVGAAKELFKAFEERLGEVMASQRLASSEARNEAANARALLRKLVQRAEETASDQRAALDMLRENWWFNIEENAKASGAEMALTFGEKITEGLEQRLTRLTEDVERATRRFGWISALKWGTGIAFGIALSIAIGVWALVPSVEGLSHPQVRAAMARIVRCQVGKELHVCVQLDQKPVVAEGVAVVRGM
jgi:hypothetical protein